MRFGASSNFVVQASNWLGTSFACQVVYAADGTRLGALEELAASSEAP